jgi:hypothetical protein
MNWRDYLPIHPAAELFPRMTDAELDEIAKDIKKRGLQQPIVLWSPGYEEDGKNDRPRYVLDGINRLDACERAWHRVFEQGQRSSKMTQSGHSHFTIAAMQLDP